MSLQRFSLISVENKLFTKEQQLIVLGKIDISKKNHFCKEWRLLER